MLTVRAAGGASAVHRRLTRRRAPDTAAAVAALVAALAVCGVAARQNPPPQPAQPPVFRGGTTLVQVDAIVADAAGEAIVDLTAADFEVLDDGRPVPIERVRFLGAEVY